MALTVKAAFSAGELDPALHERTTLDKYKNGLATARNVAITKIGTIASRQGRAHDVQCKLDDSIAVLYSPPGSGLILEFGHMYLRVYTLAGVAVGDVASLISRTMIPSLHFETSGSYVYIFCAGQEIKKFNYISGFFSIDNSIFAIPVAPTATVLTPAGVPTGYKVEYAVTAVINGQESFPLLNQGNINVPIAAGQTNGILATLTTGLPTGLTEMRVYRRPTGAGAYGFIGAASGSAITTSGGNYQGFLLDLGQDADYSHSFPTVITSDGGDPIELKSGTGIIYQQSLLISDSVTDLEAIYRSQPGYQNNFFRNYPLDSASALKFKSGTSGYARVRRMLDDDGLVVFTSAGIYLSQGELSPDNLALVKKGKGIINAALPPLAIPGGSLYVDEATNAVRSLTFDWASQKFIEPDLSIYSAHLFRTRSFSSWNFQSGVFPLLWIVFNDGTFASFTYENDEQMKAWTRHDSAAPITVESSCGTIDPDKTYFIVKKTVNGVVKRYIEHTLPRYVPASIIAIDPEYDKNPTIAYMDSTVSWVSRLQDSLLGTDILELSPTTIAQDWSLPLNLTCGTSNIFGVIDAALAQVGGSIVGMIFRYFDADGSTWDLEVTSLVNGNAVIVEPSSEFPSSAARSPRLYKTASTFSGLDHMEGEYPSVIVDGAVICSPNNDEQSYATAQVINGQLTLPSGLVGAMVHIGRPIIGDVETLDIDTVEQSPTLIESMTVNKLYIKVHNSQGIYVANKYPVDTVVKGMQPIDQYDVDYSQDNPIIGNRAAVAQTKRIEVTLPGDWKSNGKIALRQVDPLHFEVLSIIPDCEILNRSDR